MTTEKQKAANQANAQKSTGPKTTAGKEVSSRNAMTHGLTGGVIFHHGESAEAYAALRKDYLQEFTPSGRYEAELVERLINIDWRLRRVVDFEALLVGAAGYRVGLGDFASQEPPLVALGRAITQVFEDDHFEKLGRYERRLIKLRKQAYMELEALWEDSGRRRRPAPVIIEHGEGPPALVKVRGS